MQWKRKFPLGPALFVLIGLILGAVFTTAINHPTLATAAPAASAISYPLTPPDPIPGEGSRTFAETGKTVRGIFLKYWNEHGGLAQQGLPISGEIGEVSRIDGQYRTVQYFERAVFEYHKDYAGSPYVVSLSLLGNLLWGIMYGQQPCPVPLPPPPPCGTLEQGIQALGFRDEAALRRYFGIAKDAPINIEVECGGLQLHSDPLGSSYLGNNPTKNHPLKGYLFGSQPNHPEWDGNRTGIPVGKAWQIEVISVFLEDLPFMHHDADGNPTSESAGPNPTNVPASGPIDWTSAESIRTHLEITDAQVQIVPCVPHEPVCWSVGRPDHGSFKMHNTTGKDQQGERVEGGKGITGIPAGWNDLVTGVTLRP
jgi:hypothetical protein